MSNKCIFQLGIFFATANNTNPMCSFTGVTMNFLMTKLRALFLLLTLRPDGVKNWLIPIAVILSALMIAAITSLGVYSVFQVHNSVVGVDQVDVTDALPTPSDELTLPWAAPGEVTVEPAQPSLEPVQEAPLPTAKAYAGSTLWGIAVRECGNGSRWTDILELNGLDKPEDLQPGIIKLPSDCTLQLPPIKLPDSVLVATSDAAASPDMVSPPAANPDQGVQDPKDGAPEFQTSDGQLATADEPVDPPSVNSADDTDKPVANSVPEPADCLDDCATADQMKQANKLARQTRRVVRKLDNNVGCFQDEILVLQDQLIYLGQIQSMSQANAQQLLTNADSWMSALYPSERMQQLSQYGAFAPLLHKVFPYVQVYEQNYCNPNVITTR